MDDQRAANAQQPQRLRKFLHQSLRINTHHLG